MFFLTTGSFSWGPVVRKIMIVVKKSYLSSSVMTKQKHWFCPWFFKMLERPVDGSLILSRGPPAVIFGPLSTIWSGVHGMSQQQLHATSINRSADELLVWITAISSLMLWRLCWWNPRLASSWAYSWVLAYVRNCVGTWQRSPCIWSQQVGNRL